jgi:hypothetical protein
MKTNRLFWGTFCLCWFRGSHLCKLCTLLSLECVSRVVEIWRSNVIVCYTSIEALTGPYVIIPLRENHEPFQFSAIFLPASISLVRTFVKTRFYKAYEHHLDTSNQTSPHFITELSDRLMNVKRSSRVRMECSCYLFFIITVCKNKMSFRGVQNFNDFF